MSQLSTHTVNEKLTMMKNIQDEINKIPDYLTKRNKSFKQMRYQVLSTMELPTTNNNMEELRKITILKYKIMFIQTYHALWTAYLKSGIGQLIIESKEQLNYSINLSVWPKDIKIIIRKSTNMNNTNENEICMNFVSNYIYELDHQLKKYEAELNKRKNNLYGYTLTIKQMLETYIQHNLSSLRIEMAHKTELVYYDYHIQTLKLAYYHQNPNEYQVCVYK